MPSLDPAKPHAYEWDHFRVVKKWGLGVQIGVCRCGKDYASAVHFRLDGGVRCHLTLPDQPVKIAYTTLPPPNGAVVAPASASSRRW